MWESTEFIAVAMLAASFLVTVCLTPVVRRLAIRWGVVDQPGPRKVHSMPTPRMGGMAIFLGWLLPVGVAVLFRQAPWAAHFGQLRVVLGVILAASAMFALGLYDDFRGASARVKLPVQIAAAVALFAVGFSIERVSNPFGASLYLGVFALPVTVLWIVGITNAVNLMDGIDGLAAGVSALMALVMAFAAQHGENVSSSGILYAVPIAGAALGFLVYNFPPANIFMGDCGSLFLGFTLATISLLSCQKGHAAAGVFVSLMIFGVPVTDTALALLRRYLTGKSLFEADRRHVHHVLLARGMSPRHTVFVLYAMTALFGGAALLLVNASSQWAPFIIAAVVAVVLLACSRLGYYEFQHVRDFVKHGPGYRQTMTFRLDLVGSAGAAILQEHSFDGVWDTVRGVAHMLGFDRVVFEPDLASLVALNSPGPVAHRTSKRGDNGSSASDAPATAALGSWPVSRPESQTRTDFRPRRWAKTGDMAAGPAGYSVTCELAGADRTLGTLTFERIVEQRQDRDERAALEHLCGFVVERILTLEGEIANRGTPRAPSDDEAGQ